MREIKVIKEFMGNLSKARKRGLVAYKFNEKGFFSKPHFSLKHRDKYKWLLGFFFNKFSTVMKNPKVMGLLSIINEQIKYYEIRLKNKGSTPRQSISAEVSLNSYLEKRLKICILQRNVRSLKQRQKSLRRSHVNNSAV
jgi:hypothetical protein